MEQLEGNNRTTSVKEVQALLVNSRVNVLFYYAKVFPSVLKDAPLLAPVHWMLSVWRSALAF